MTLVVIIVNIMNHVKLCFFIYLFIYLFIHLFIFIEKKTTKGSKKDLALAAAHTKIHGTATLCVKMYKFFSGAKSNTTKLGKPTGNIEEMLLSVSLDNDLLSEIQKRELNPMVIRVSSAHDLPNKPISYMGLRER